MADPKVRKKPVTLEASGAKTADGNSTNTTEAVHYKRARVYLDVTAVTGTDPTLAAHIRSKDPVSGKMMRVASFPQMTAAGEQVLDIEALGEEIDVEWDVGGTTPSFTFSVGAVLET